MCATSVVLKLLCLKKLEGFLRSAWLSKVPRCEMMKWEAKNESLNTCSENRKKYFKTKHFKILANNGMRTKHVFNKMGMWNNQGLKQVVENILWKNHIEFLNNVLTNSMQWIYYGFPISTLALGILKSIQFMLMHL